jgi:hypothetical protein
MKPNSKSLMIVIDLDKIAVVQPSTSRRAARAVTLRGGKRLGKRRQRQSPPVFSLSRSFYLSFPGVGRGLCHLRTPARDAHVATSAAHMAFDAQLYPVPVLV